MPYRHAHWWVAMVAVVTVAGFWDSYFMKFGEANAAFHAHAFSASAWIVLVGVQSWAIHHGHRTWHRTLGKCSLALFPLMIASFVGIINVSAAGFIAGDIPFYQRFGPVFGWAMMLALIAYIVVFTQALRHRRNVWWHAGFMLTTPFILWESPFSRVIERWVPGQRITGPENIDLIGHQIAFCMAMAVVFALYIGWRHGRRGWPFVVVAALITVQALGMYLIAPTGAWRAVFTVYAQVPPPVTVGIGLALGVIAGRYGWRFPASPTTRRSP